MIIETGEYEGNSTAVADSKVPKVSVVILNWNGWQDTVECVRSVNESNYPLLDTIVVDNGSTDDSVQRIRAAYPGITLIETKENLGFSGGNNYGLRAALDRRANYVFVLNNDTIVFPECISKLIEFGKSHPEAALIGPRICDKATGEFLDLPMIKRVTLLTILLTKSPIKRLIDKTLLYGRFFYRDHSPGVVYAIHGSAMMFKASALKEIELFDEKTFIYWEEFIIAEKLRSKGLLTYVVPDARLWHTGGSSISKIGVRKFLENVKSEKYFFSTYLHLSSLSLSIIYAVRFVGYVGRAITDSEYRESFRSFIRLLFQERA